MAQPKRKDKSRVVLRKGEVQRANGTYHYCWTDGKGKRHFVYAKTLEELRDKEAEIEKDKSDGIKAEAKYTTINDLFDLWKQLKRGLKNNTFENYKYMYDTFVRPEFGKTRISSLKKSDVKRFYNRLADDRGLQPSTIDSIHTVLHQVLDMAVDDDYLRSNPSSNVLRELKQSHCFETEKRRGLTKPEQDLFLDFLKRKLTYEITDWVVKCSGAECMSGAVYASTGYGFLCLPRSITQRLADAKRVFDEADAWLDLWCHTTYEDYGNAFSFLAPVVQYGRFGSVLTLETLGERWGWEKTKVWRFFKKHGDVFPLYRLPSSYGCLVFNTFYPTGADTQLPEQDMVMRILREILICSTYKCKDGSENLRVNHMVAWYSRAVILSQQMQSAPEISECRVALSDPITRAYLSHGWNCKHCRNYHYACPGMLEGTPCFFRSGYEIRGPCTRVENHEYNTTRRYCHEK